MTPKKARGRAQPRVQVPLPPVEPSDYESEAPVSMPAAPPTRTNEELNLSVLRRHFPSVGSVLSIAPYVVLYQLAEECAQWVKPGVEGTLFVCKLAETSIETTEGLLENIEKYSVIILNRRGLENFYAELMEAARVEITEEYVILQVKRPEEELIFGLWIYCEPPPSVTADSRALNARIIKECATQAEQSCQRALEVLRQKFRLPSLDHQDDTEIANGASMGRQISLREHFGQQREHDSGWSIKDHSLQKGRTRK